MSMISDIFSEQYIKSLLEGVAVSLSHNSILFNENDSCEEIYFILSGDVKLLKNNLVISFAKSNEFIGLTSVVLGKDKYTFSAKCKSNVELFKIKKEDFLHVLLSNSEFCKRVIELLSISINKADDKIILFTHNTSNKKIIFEILNHLNENNICDLLISELHEITGVSDKSIQSILNTLKKTNLITFKNGIITVLDVKQLKMI